MNKFWLSLITITLLTIIVSLIKPGNLVQAQVSPVSNPGLDTGGLSSLGGDISPVINPNSNEPGQFQGGFHTDGSVDVYNVPIVFGIPPGGCGASCPTTPNNPTPSQPTLQPVTIGGKVNDECGVVPGVTIQLYNDTTKTTTPASTGADGRFVFNNAFNSGTSYAVRLTVIPVQDVSSGKTSYEGQDSSSSDSTKNCGLNCDFTVKSASGSCPSPSPSPSLSPSPSPVPACGIACDSKSPSACAGAKDGCNFCNPSINVCETTPACGSNCARNPTICQQAVNGCTFCKPSTNTCQGQPVCNSTCATDKDCSGAKDGCSACINGSCQTPFNEAACKCAGIDSTQVIPGQAALITQDAQVTGSDVSKAQVTGINFRIYKRNGDQGTWINSPGDERPVAVTSNTPTSVSYRAQYSFTLPSTAQPGDTYSVLGKINCGPKSPTADLLNLHNEIAVLNQQDYASKNWFDQLVTWARQNLGLQTVNKSNLAQADHTQVLAASVPAAFCADLSSTPWVYNSVPECTGRQPQTAPAGGTTSGGGNNQLQLQTFYPPAATQKLGCYSILYQF